VLSKASRPAGALGRRQEGTPITGKVVFCGKSTGQVGGHACCGDNYLYTVFYCVIREVCGDIRRAMGRDYANTGVYAEILKLVDADLHYRQVAVGTHNYGDG